MVVARALLLISLAGCGATAPPLPVQHPANPQSTPGRLAPAPTATRAGAVRYPDVPPLRTEAPAEHSHHDHGGDSK